MLSMVCDEDVILDAFEAGATGFLSKNSSIAELVDAIKRACEGTAVMSVELTKKVVNYASSIRRRALGKCELNEEQVHLLSLVCQGYENKDIVSIMNSSIATIKLRFHEINNLLRVKNKTQAVIEALRRGIITLDR
jgi:DNA-binding NarL/FixJ family response regulator